MSTDNKGHCTGDITSDIEPRSKTTQSTYPEVEFSLDDESDFSAEGARLRVIGVGGAGCKAIECMAESTIKDVDMVAMNTDMKALRNLQGRVNQSTRLRLVQIGPKATRGLGAGSLPENGAKAANESESEIRRVVEDNDMVFITAGLGGGTGTGASPLVAKIAKEAGVLTVGVVTLPFNHEGKRKWRVAKEGMERMLECVDSLIVIPNEKIQSIFGQTTAIDGYKHSDQVLADAVYGISELINTAGDFGGVDFADVRTCLVDKGLAVISIGEAKASPRCAQEAIENALHNPMLEDCDIRGAKGILCNIIGTTSTKIQDIGVISQTVNELADEDAITKVGTIIEREHNSMDGGIRVILVASGISINGLDYPLPAQQEAPPPHHFVRPEAGVTDAEQPTTGQPHRFGKKARQSGGDTLTAQPLPDSGGAQKFTVSLPPKSAQKPEEGETSLDEPAYLRRRKKYVDLGKFTRKGQWLD